MRIYIYTLKETIYNSYRNPKPNPNPNPYEGLHS